MNIITIMKKFATDELCIKHLELVRWNNSPICVYCKGDKISRHLGGDERRDRWQCSTCKKSFSVLVGTIFHHTHLPLQKWFLAISLILNAKKGISSRQLARDIEVTKDTAWRVQMQIRKAMEQYPELLKGIIEMDETYIGGKPRKGTGIHKRGRGTSKIPVVGMVERDGKIKAKVQSKESLKFKDMKKLVSDNVDTKNAVLMTDDYRGYSPMSKVITHKIINHLKKQYADGIIHTNTIEGFWALLKRGITGQYHHLSRKYLERYVDEFCFKYNNRSNENVFSLILTNGVFCGR